MNLYSKIALIAAIGGATPAAFAGGAAHRDFDITNYIYRKAPSSVFDDLRARRKDDINRQLCSATTEQTDISLTATAADTQPSKVIGPSHIMGDLDAPNGEIWFYDGKLTYDSIPPDYENGIWFTDLILRRYDITIYNGKMEVVGTISDKMRYDEDEIRAPLVDVSPIVTQKFYNTDDYYEIAVGVATNPGVGRVREHSFIYSLGNGQKDAEGNDVPITDMRSFISDVLVIDNTIGRENYLISVARGSGESYDSGDDDEIWTGDPADSPYWKSLISQKMVIDVYGNATPTSDGPVKIASKEIPSQQLQGDQMNAPVIMSTIYNGEGYMMIAKYEEPFFNPFSSPQEENVTMREKNNLIVEIFKQSADKSKLELFQTTKIPVTKDTSDERILATYYSVGSLRYREDLDFNPAHYKNTSGKAYLIVSRQNYLAGRDDSYISSYYIHKDTGVRYKTIFTNAESTLALSDVEGCEPQQVFVTNESGYEFHFVDLLSVNEVYSTSSQFNMGEDEEPEALTANMDRTGADGSYQYAIELRVPSVDENENDNIRVLWITPKGEVDHIDEVNMGTNVMYGKMFINGSVLRPGIFTTSKENPAYMCLIKRGIAGSAVQEELMVAEPKSEAHLDGRTLLTCGPNANGVLSTVMPVTRGKDKQLWVFYVNHDTDRLTLDIYDLPLDKNQSGVDDVIADAGAESIVYDGETISAAGRDITVYSIAGVTAASGHGSVATANLAPGIYIVNAGESTKKIAVK